MHRVNGARRKRSFIAAVRKGIALHKERGLTIAQVTKEIGVPWSQFYRGRDVLLLSDRDDLSVGERRIVAESMALLESGQTPAACALVRPIALRIWGHARWRYKIVRPERQMSVLTKSVDHIFITCEHTDQLKVPRLEKKRANELTGQLKKAEGALKHLRGRIAREVKHG